jgi:hypothetical protein
MLDPASQLSVGATTGLFRDYDLDGNTDGVQSAFRIGGNSYFKDRFKFSKAFVGSNSIAGSDRLSLTTNKSLEMRFNGLLAGPGSEHGGVHQVYNRLISDTKLYSQYLNIYDDGSVYPYPVGDNLISNNMDGMFRVIKKDQDSRNYIEYLLTSINPNEVDSYGTSQDNIIGLSQDVVSNALPRTSFNYYGAGGNDQFDTLVSGRVNIHDFGNGNDKLLLYKDSEGKYLIEDRGQRGAFISDGSSNIYVRGNSKNQFIVDPDPLSQSSNLVSYREFPVYR